MTRGPRRAATSCDIAQPRPAGVRHHPADHVRGAVRLRVRRRGLRSPDTPATSSSSFPASSPRPSCSGPSTPAIGIAEDMSKGFIDRLRSLPLYQPAVLIGRTFSDLLRNVFTFFVMLIVGFAVGFRLEGGIPKAILATLLLLDVRLGVQLDPGANRAVGEVGRGGQLRRVHLDVPVDVHLLRVREHRDACRTGSPADRRRQPVHDRHQRQPGALQRQRSRATTCGWSLLWAVGITSCSRCCRSGSSTRRRTDPDRDTRDATDRGSVGRRVTERDDQV